MAREKSEFEHVTGRGGFLDVELGRGWRAPFTGFSWVALEAFVPLAAAWYRADNANRPHIETAMRAVLHTLQKSELEAARIAIYGVGNENDMLRLWPRIAPPVIPAGMIPPKQVEAGAVAGRAILTRAIDDPAIQNKMTAHNAGAVALFATALLPPRAHEPSMGVKHAEAINAELERRATGGWAK